MTPRGRLLLLSAFFLLLVVALWSRVASKKRATGTGPLTNALQIVQHSEIQEASKYWGPELRAQEQGRTIEKLWDELNRSTNKLALLTRTELGSILLAGYDKSAQFAHGIEVYSPNREARSLSRDDWGSYLETAWAAGWELVQCEFRHNRFTVQPPSSVFYFSAHLLNAREERRAILEGDLTVEWKGNRINRIDATRVEVRSRQGQTGFKSVFHDEVMPVEGSYFVDPLIVWDLDNDGQPEVILAAKNRVYRRTPNGPWEHSTLCSRDPGLIFSGVLGDFNGDGQTDFLVAKFDGLSLYEGTDGRSFPNPPRPVWAAQPRLKYAQAFAIGDVDGDGDLDLFLGQYKVPYDKGQMPKPYFEANDGHPSFLLINDGRGNFTDATQKAGLGAKRGRRVYNASLIDLDRDGDLDLVTVSDFAGLDAWENQGAGHFKDVSATWFPERVGLGMASCFADWNRDGQLDLLMIGMNSPTADRLAALGLRRPYDHPDDGKRDAVTFGNRLLFGTAKGAFRQAEMGARVARTGWSWGCTGEDFDNDGYPDLYIANGHETRASVQDYETEFWLHDIYVGDSAENSLAQLYFREKMARTRGAGWSYGGYEKNRFFLNLGGTNFLECGWLMGIALETDSRNVIGEDLDGDGRSDLVVTTFEIYPKVRQSLQIFRNELELPARENVRRYRDLKQSGAVTNVTGNFAQALLSTGSYRSQTQPRLNSPLKSPP